MNTAMHAELTADGQRIVLIAAGPVDEIQYAAKLLEATTPLIKPTQPPGGLFLPASWPAVVQLAATYGSNYVPGPALTAWTSEQLARRTDVLADTLTAPVPDGLTPRPYQVEGALEIARTGRALILDEPRTGKTVTTILGLAELYARRQISDFDEEPAALPIVVVCPASVVDPWVELFRAWAPYWTTVAWRGSPARRKKLAGTADVYVTSYDTAVRDAKDTNPSKSPLIALNHRGLVVDEFHRIKNHNTARSHAVRRLARNVTSFVGLSGTPITHHPANAWPALTCLAPGAWPARERWVNRYCLSGVAEYGESILGLHPGVEDEFRVAVMGQMRRKARADVMSQLPDKVYSVRTVELPDAHRKAYDQFENEMLAELPDDGGELAVMDALSKLGFLSRLACAAADVRITLGPETDDFTGEPKKHIHLDLKAPSWKVDALLELLDERPDEQVVAFTVSAQLATLAGEAAEKAGRRVGYIIGGQTPTQRTAAREAFQAGELDLICATTSAGGEGITLSAAGTLAFLQRPWSIVESLQAEDRGEGDLTQTRGTEIVDIVAADTIDTRVRAVLRERAGQLADFVRDPRIVAQLLGGASIHQLKRSA